MRQYRYDNMTWGTAMCVFALGLLVGFATCHIIYTGGEGYYGNMEERTEHKVREVFQQ